MTWSRSVRARRLIVPMLLAVLLLAGCSSDDDDVSTSGGDDTTTETSDEAKDDKVGNVRGFDGTTIKVAGIGIKGQLPGTEFGVRGRIKRFNDTNELAGVKIEYLEFVDDKQDPATALSEVRRLVTGEKIFAIVGDVSQNNPGEYLAQQKVPYFGFAFDSSYCSSEPDDSLWGFGYNGCLVPKTPKKVPDSGRNLYKYLKELGKDRPTLALFSSDSQSGRDAAKFQGVAYEGAGFEVTLAKALVPLPPVSDYTPYVQQLLKSGKGGAAPDAIYCLLTTDCIPIYRQLRSSGYRGEFLSPLYSPLLVGSMEGSLAQLLSHNLDERSPGMDQMRTDVKAVKADQILETGSVAGYLSTDMFIQALKKAAEKGKSGITPEKVRDAAAHQTWELEGVAGPTRYPDSTVAATPSCAAVARSDGKTWINVVEYNCSDKKHDVE